MNIWAILGFLDHVFLSFFMENDFFKPIYRSRQNYLVEKQPMRRLYLERTLNIKQERLREDVSQWLNCRFLPNLPMIFTHCLEMRSQVT